VSPRGAVLVAALALAACGTPRVHVTTGTTIGLKATPGDGQTRPPSVVIGYKRAEVALVPTTGEGASVETDAASTLASLHFSTRWFGHTELDSFIATGRAATPLVKSESQFSQEMARATLGMPSPETVQRQRTLVGLLTGMTEPQAQAILDDLGLPRRQGKDAVFSLQDYIARADSAAALERLEAAFFRRR
jgi:hypothetical protein